MANSVTVTLSPSRPVVHDSVVTCAPPRNLRLSPTESLQILMHVTAHRCQLMDHVLCEACGSRSREASVWRLQHDLVLFCHPKGDIRNSCPLLQAPSAPRDKRTCFAVAHGRCYYAENSSVVELLHTCGDERHGCRQHFHLVCAGYNKELQVPSTCKLLCSECLDAHRGGTPLLTYQQRHVWEAVHALPELYHSYKLQVVNVASEFPTVMYMANRRYVFCESCLNVCKLTLS